jgi:opacity protein-like surface antigen
LERPVKLFVALALISVLGSGPVLAADFPLPTPEPTRPPTIYDPNGPYTNWAGAYLGLNGGYALGSSQWTLGLFGTDVFNTNGFLFGGTVGFNFPVSAVLVGVEGDIDWSGLSGSAPNCAVNASGAMAACQTKSNLLGTARARVGYAVDRTLIYVTGGAAFAPVQTGLKSAIDLRHGNEARLGSRRRRRVCLFRKLERQGRIPLCRSRCELLLDRCELRERYRLVGRVHREFGARRLQLQISLVNAEAARERCA